MKFFPSSSNSTFCRVTTARKKFHAKHKTELEKAVKISQEILAADLKDNFLWESKKHNAAYAAYTISVFMHLVTGIKTPTTTSFVSPKNPPRCYTIFLQNVKNFNQLILNSYVEKLMDLANHLWIAGRKDLLKQLQKDPFYGHDSSLELSALIRKEEYEESEDERQAKLHPNIRALQQIGNRFPWICSVCYPYSHPSVPELPPNTLTVLGDGFPIFRMEVLDPEECTLFRMLEIMKGSDYWFDFNIPELCHKIDGSDLSIDGFKKLMEKSLSKNLNRHKN